MKKKIKQSLSIIWALLMFVSCTNSQQSKSTKEEGKYKETWESLSGYEREPEWFKDAKFGIYFHWGVYSVPAFANEWYPRNMYIKGTAESKHHMNTYGDISQWPYNNFITGAPDKQGNFVQFAPKLRSEGGNFRWSCGRAPRWLFYVGQQGKSMERKRHGA
jgi:hypothetical protein